MRRLTALALASAAGVALLGGSACGERGEPTGPSASLYPLTVSIGTGKPLVVEQPLRRIAIVAPELASIVRALGLSRDVVGTPVAPNGEIRLGELRAIRPDLVLASSALDQRQIARARTAANAPVYVVGGSSIREVERGLTQLALLTDRSVAARRLVAAIEAKRRLVAARLRGVRPVSVFVDTGFFTTVPDDSLIGRLVAEAHGRNVAGRGGGAGNPVDLSTLARLDPRVYLATSDSGTTLADLRKIRRTRNLTAIRSNRFVVVDSSLLEPGPRIGDGLLAVARALHPDAFR